MSFIGKLGQVYAGLYGVHLLLMLRFLVTLRGQGDAGSLSAEGIVQAGHRYLLQKDMGKSYNTLSEHGNTGSLFTEGIMIPEVRSIRAGKRGSIGIGTTTDTRKNEGSNL